MSPFNDPIHFEVRGTARPLPAPRAEEESSVPFGTGEEPQIEPDGSAVYYPTVRREVFYFNGATRRAVILELWRARQRGRPWMNQLALLGLVGSHGTRLVELFRQPGGYHPAWGTLIVRGPTVGSYGLART